MTLSSPVVLTCALIVVARIMDVSLGTLRTLFIVQGARAIAASLGFFEILIWVVVVSRVVNHMDQWAYFVSYAGGFSIGTYVGMLIEARIATGRQVVRIFTRKGSETAHELRSHGYIVTEFAGQGRSGHVDLLFLETSRRSAPDLLDRLHTVDPDAFSIVDDVRTGVDRPRHDASIWRRFLTRRK